MLSMSNNENNDDKTQNFVLVDPEYSLITKELEAAFDLARAESNNNYVYIFHSDSEQDDCLMIQTHNQLFTREKIEELVTDRYRESPFALKPKLVASFHLNFSFKDQIMTAIFDPFDVQDWDTLKKFPVGYTVDVLAKPIEDGIDFSRIENQTTNLKTLEMIRASWIQAVIINNDVIRTPKCGKVKEVINTTLYLPKHSNP